MDMNNTETYLMKQITEVSERMLVEAFQMLNRISVSGKPNVFNLGNAMTNIETVVNQINEERKANEKAEESSKEEKED